MNNESAENKVYNALCNVLEKNGWDYYKFEENLTICSSAKDGVTDIEFFIKVDAEKKLVMILSPEICKMKRRKRAGGAVIACVASCGLTDGCFSCDMSSGLISFRMSTTFFDHMPGEDTFNYMLSCAFAAVSKYKAKLCDVSKGRMSVEKFVEENNGFSCI